MRTANFLKKTMVRTFFSERGYHRIKFIKICLDYIFGRPYDEIIRELPRWIAATGTIIDIGANMGQYMCRLSAYFPKARIISIEPIPVNHEYLIKMATYFKIKNVEILESAISDHCGTATMVTPYIKDIPITTQSGLLDSANFPPETRLAANEVHSITIDELASRLHVTDVTLIKVDVEGAEDRVLHGARHTIMKYKPLLLLETTVENKAVQKLIESGYGAYYVFEKELVPYNTGNPRGDLILQFKQGNG